MRTSTLHDHVLADRAEPILLSLACAGENPITYGTLAVAIGTVPVNLGNVLSVILRRCVAANLPMLTAFVVQSDSGEPGDMLHGELALIGHPDTRTAAEMRRDAHVWALWFYADAVRTHSTATAWPLAIGDLQQVSA